MSRVDEIRARLETARRAWSFIGAIGVARDDVVYLLDRVRELEGFKADAERLHDCATHLHIKLVARDRAPSSAAVVTGGARVRAYECPAAKYHASSGLTVMCHRYRDHDGEHIGHATFPVGSGGVKVYW